MSFVAPAKFCFCFSLILLGFYHIAVDALFSNYAAPVVSVLVLLLCLVMFLVRVPPPSREAVERIIGKDPLFAVQNEAGIVRSVAHRGAGLDAPENSLQAFKNCAERGVNFIELDVHLTKDDVPIVFHDNDLERLTNEKVCIEDTPYSKLKEIDISVKHPLRDKFEKTKIPTLDETIVQLLAHQQKMFIDIKYNNNKMVETILKAFKTHSQLYSNAVVSSFFPNLIYAIRKRDPNIVCSLAWRPYAFKTQTYSYPQGGGALRSTNFIKNQIASILDWLHSFTLPRFTYYLLGISVILLHKDCVSGETVLDWQKKGVRVMVWTVNHPVEKNYFSKILKVTYLTDTLIGENNAHSS